ncbi:MAG: hypothetical protein ACR2FH_05280 [Caulobacteraceae bacterium]
MPLALVMALAGLLAWPFHPTQQATHTYSQPTWLFSIRRDRFTGAVECRVFQGHKRPSVAFARRSLAFRFPSRLNTLRASYRVDGAPAVAWTTVYPTLVAAGANLPGASLDNPTSGLVILPLSALAGGHMVTIRPTPRSSPRAFYIDGLAEALAAAEVRGCVPDAAFVR